MDEILDKLLESLIEAGPLGAVIVVCCYFINMIYKDHTTAQKEHNTALYKILETNTEALTVNATSNGEVSTKLKELSDAQNRRRTEFGNKA